jgi:hypothetical protein
VTPSGDPVIEALIAVAVEREQALDLAHGGSLGRGHLTAAIDVIAVALQLPAQPADAAGARPRISAAWIRVSCPSKARMMTCGLSWHAPRRRMDYSMATSSVAIPDTLRG